MRISQCVQKDRGSKVRSRLATTDSLYGDVSLPDGIRQLVSLPIVQRLRHVRLSNIDSIAMPGISGLTRFEHVLGVAYLASRTAYAERLASQDRLCLIAAALLHDWAITAFGHLVEEGFAYAGVRFDHEHKLSELVQNEARELGGAGLQILNGRGSGLPEWAEKWVPSDDALRTITDAIEGVGKFGGMVKSDIDLDNIDNVYRMAYHMGLAVDRETPVRIAECIQGMDENGGVVFARGALSDILEWQDVRAQVYQHLMPAQPDFAAKVMLLYCTRLACNAGEISPLDWNLTDHQFLSTLKSSRSEVCRETVARWEVGEFWSTSPLMWMSGTRPPYSNLARFSDLLTEELGRTCFVYAIKDKRNRPCRVHWSDGTMSHVGEPSDRWLVGVGSPQRKSFTATDTRHVRKCIQDYFKTTEVADEREDGDQSIEGQASLL